jgi:hypothetical protein
VLASKLFDDSLLVTSGNGRLKDTKGEMADVAPSAGLQIHYFRTRDVVVRPYGNARRRYTAVYARGGPLGWRMVALHIGPAPEG